MPSLNETIPERTAQIIRERILAHETGFRPGDRLYPGALSADLGVSITPIREALKVLSGDGLLVVAPRRGVRVVNPTEKELMDLLDVQEGLEELALALTPGAADLGPVEEVLRRAEEALERGDVAECRLLSTEFHRRLVGRSGNVPLTSLYNTLLTRAQILDVYYPRSAVDVVPSMREHQELVRQLQQGPSASIERALRGHWSETKRRTSQRLRENGRGAMQHDGARRR